jgi:hypothetical protein
MPRVTRGARKLPSKLTLPSIAVALALAVAGCGGGSTKKHSSSTSSTSSTTTTTAKTPVATAKTPLSLTVRTAGSTTPFGSTAKAKAGDPVIFRTVPAGNGTSKAADVTLKISGGPSKSLTITASSKGHTSVATITSADGKPITLVRLHYGCALPPVATFCPAKHSSTSSHGFELLFSTLHTAPIVLAALVGPVTTPAPVVHPASSSVVPAYTPTELVEGVTLPAPGAKKGTPAKTTGLAATATVKPGNSVVMATRLAGRPVGAPQTTTLTIDQGPASSITVSAAVAGGLTSKAVVKSADGKRITLVLPRYSCFVAPAPTFCPPKTIKALHHKYVLTFQASPYTPPLSFIATAAAG